MAILRSLDGKFYEIPDSLLSSYLIPADKVEARMKGDDKDPDALDDDELRAISGGTTPGPACEWHNRWTPA
jgi:hypothetical protein